MINPYQIREIEINTREVLGNALGTLLKMKLAIIKRNMEKNNIIEYKANLDGLTPTDMLQCTNGDRLRITSYEDVSLRKANAQVLIYAGGLPRPTYATIYHSDKDNNCWKFYNPIK